MEESTILVKTLYWDRDPIEKFGELETAMFTDEPREGEGYCVNLVDDMTRVSNQVLCETDNQKDVGYYYRVHFPNVYDYSNWCFKLPTDFGKGGLVMLDGKIIKQMSRGMNGNDSTALDFC